MAHCKQDALEELQCLGLSEQSQRFPHVPCLARTARGATVTRGARVTSTSTYCNSSQWFSCNQRFFAHPLASLRQLKYAVCVNSLWFLDKHYPCHDGHQWVRRQIRVTQVPIWCFVESLNKSQLPLIVELLPTFPLSISSFQVLLAPGLLDFNRTVW